LPAVSCKAREGSGFQMLRGQEFSRMIGLLRDPLSMTMRWQIFAKQARLSYLKRGNNG